MSTAVDRSRRRPLKLFVSYTSREEEVRELQPLLDRYREELIRLLPPWAAVFYDRWSLPPWRYNDDELRQLLHSEVVESDFLIAFMSPQYLCSRWTCYEWADFKSTREREDRAPALVTHPIYWKPSLWAYGDLGPDEYDPLMGSGEGVLADLSGDYLMTDVTYAFFAPRRVAEAAFEAARETYRRLRSAFPEVFV
jgi:hypothetical protein